MTTKTAELAENEMVPDQTQMHPELEEMIREAGYEEI